MDLSEVRVGDHLILQTYRNRRGSQPRHLVGTRVVEVIKRTPCYVWVTRWTGHWKIDGTPYGRKLNPTSTHSSILRRPMTKTEVDEVARAEAEAIRREHEKKETAASAEETAKELTILRAMQHDNTAGEIERLVGLARTGYDWVELATLMGYVDEKGEV